MNLWDRPPPRRGFRETLLALVLIAIPILCLRANLKSPQNLNAVDRVVLKLTSPLQRGMTALIQAVTGAWNGYVNLIGLRREVEVLRKENARLREELAQARREAAAAARYEKLLGLRDEGGGEKVAARVIAVDPSPHFRIVRVQFPKGAGGLVKKDMAVLAPEGLVGRVFRVYGDYGDVQLAVDPASTFDAVVPRSGVHCLIDGIPGSNKFRCRLEGSVGVDDVRVGDVLVTSQLNGQVPRDVTIGHVAWVEPPRGTVQRNADVLPAVDFTRLTDVLVVLKEPPPPPPSSQPRRRGGRREVMP